ncbi:MAG: transporter substrate-binding domain-containing protein [SAR324 cluster bacterium]|nr:transporter substrate-binding domain-containing protein [SAR324 cluster bacterium]
MLKGKPAGAYTEIVREIARALDMDLVIRKCPLARCLIFMKEGTADIMMGLRKSKERESFMNYLTTPYREGGRTVFYISNKKSFDIEKYEDLSKLSIGVKKGAVNFSKFDKDTELNKNFVTTNEQNFKMLVLGRVDTVVASETLGDGVVYDLGYQQEVRKAKFSPNKKVFAFIPISKKSHLVSKTARLEDAMTQMIKNGTLKKIYLEHYYQAYNLKFEEEGYVGVAKWP